MKKWIARTNQPALFDSFERPMVTAVLGPRRVGKTTLFETFKRAHPERLVVALNMDLLSQRERINRQELELLIEQAALQKIGRGPKLWVFIDEAQKCPQLFDQIKVLYDRNKGTDAIKFILTGSAHLNLHQLTAESLAGRVELLNLREFNLKEGALLLHPNLKLPKDSIFDLIFSGGNRDFEELFLNNRPFKEVLEEVLDLHLLWGGLPEVLEADSDQARLRYLGDYLQTYLEKDIRAVDTIGDLNLYQNLMKISAEVTGSLRDDKKITEALHCSPITLGKYRNYLIATLQYIEVSPYLVSSIKRLTKSPKGYLTNNGLVSYLTGIHDLSVLKTSGLIGHRLENWFLNEIKTWLDVRAERHQVYFWRTTNGAEVDFVVVLGQTVVPFEVTYSPQVETKKLNNLKTFMKDNPEVSFGVCCYRGSLSFDPEQRILFLPIWMVG